MWNFCIAKVNRMNNYYMTCMVKPNSLTPSLLCLNLSGLCCAVSSMVDSIVYAIDFVNTVKAVEPNVSSRSYPLRHGWPQRTRTRLQESQTYCCTPKTEKHVRFRNQDFSLYHTKKKYLNKLRLNRQWRVWLSLMGVGGTLKLLYTQA